MMIPKIITFPYTAWNIGSNILVNWPTPKPATIVPNKFPTPPVTTTKKESTI